jgi:hypothetical protein
MDFITKTNFIADYQLMHKDMIDFINNAGGWPEAQTINGKYYSANQIGLKCRKNCEYPLIDSSGSLYDKEKGIFTGHERDFTEWVDNTPEYTKQRIQDLELYHNIKFGRIRYMRLMTKTGLSVHFDTEMRYHYVLETNINSFFGEKTEGELAARCYHLPTDSHFYIVDTTRNHFVYNGGWEPRIHLVLNIIP